MMNEELQYTASSHRKIQFLVIILHAIFLYFASAEVVKVAKVVQKKLLVRTVALQPHAQTSVEEFSSTESVQTYTQSAPAIQEPIDPVQGPTLHEEATIQNNAPIEAQKEKPTPIAEPIEKQKIEKKVTHQKPVTKTPPQNKQQIQQKRKTASQPAAKPIQKTATVAKKATKEQPKPKATKAISQAKKVTQSTLQKTAPKVDEAAIRAAKKVAQEAEKAAREKEALIQQAFGSIKRSETTGSQKELVVAATGSFSAKTPGQIGALSSESLVHIESQGETLTAQERTYYDELVTRLKLHLRLPEYGQVRMQLTLTKDGKVKNMTITSSKSKKNRDYVQNKLPQLTFPRFGDNFAGASAHAFHLNLSNELNY
ncbi:MAG TPA: hypothetical protein VN457_02765 [Chlamydiales bacterium]|nr:hypothetical protein [Chlamydiales bacterium]